MFRNAKHERYTDMRRVKHVFIISIVLFLFLSWAQLAFAGRAKDTSLRCGNDLINVGDSKNRVTYICGQPFSKDIIGHTKAPESTGGVEFIIERWTYDTSVRYFTILTFRGDRLVRMEDERKW